jgi:MoaA/NifB/PqqE/SkfB family radical SAM enzyme
MGFPKPYPTDWPVPEDADELPSRIEPIDDEKKREDPVPAPEYYTNCYSLTWAVNHACNLRCTHCYDAVPYKRHDMSTHQALEVIDHLYRAGITFIVFSGGEPFLRKDLLDLMAHCRSEGIGIGARANGTRISQETAWRLRELEISVVGISFDGATEETHDAVRGTGSFRATLRGLRALVTAGIRAQMEVVLSRSNAHEALKFIEVGESLGASEVNFSAMTPQGRGARRMEDLLDHKLWSDLTTLLRDASRHARISVTPNCAFVGPCFANLEPHMTCDGWMTPCYLSMHRLFEVIKVPPQDISRWLSQTRSHYQDICGRKRWTEPGRPTHAIDASPEADQG